jgi:ankyrin repeat protein
MEALWGIKPAMFRAIDSGDASEVMRLVDADPALLETGNNPWNKETPLMYAAAAGQLEIVKRLIGKGANISAMTTYVDKTALHFAAENGHEEVVAYLLQSGAQAGQQSREGFTAFMLACMRGHVCVALLLLEQMGGQAQGLEDTRSGRTVLQWAARGGHAEMVTALLGRGARADTRDRIGMSPLTDAVHGGHLGVVMLLVAELGTQALQERDGEGKGLLHHAIERRRENVVPYLLSQGLLPNLKDNQGKTALMYAARGISTGPDMRMMKTLLDFMGGEGLDERDNMGHTALHLAVYHGRPANVRALLVAGADPTIMDNQGRVPRFVGALRCYDQCNASFNVSIGGHGPSFTVRATDVRLKRGHRPAIIVLGLWFLELSAPRTSSSGNLYTHNNLVPLNEWHSVS